MSTLFEIVNEFEELYQLATDQDVDSEVWEMTLEALTGELEAKSSGYVQVIKQLEMEMTQANIVAEQFKLKAKVRENHIKQMKEALLGAMQQTGIDKVEAGDWTIKVQNNGGVQPIVIDGTVPDSFNKVTIEADTDKIRKFLLDGNKVEWAHLKERGKHISIK